MMRRVEVTSAKFLAGLVFGLVLACPEFGTAQSLEKVRIGMPSFSLSFIAPQVAYARGFFREEGIDAEIIRIATNVGIVAVTTKEIGYTSAVGAGLRSAVKGLPLKVIMYFNGHPLHVLVAKPEFKTLAELQKKIIGFAVKAQAFIRNNKTESVRVIADWLKLEPRIAQSSYEIYVKGMSVNGIVPERVIESDIERARNDQQVKESVSVGRVVDFALLRDALQQLGMK